MNCTKCGNVIPEGSAFCTTCGTPVPQPQYQQPVQPQQSAFDGYSNGAVQQPQTQYQQPQYQQPQAPAYDPYAAPAAAPMPTGYDAYGNPIYATPKAPRSNPFENLMPTVKGLFSKDFLKTIAGAYKNKGLEFIVFIAAAVVMFALSIVANVSSAIGQIYNKYDYDSSKELREAKEYARAAIPCIVTFLLFALLALIVIALIALAIFLIARMFNVEGAGIMGALNMAALVTIPFTAICVLNFIIGLIHAPLVLFTLTLALFLVAILLFASLQELVAGRQVVLHFAVALVAILVIGGALNHLFDMAVGQAAVKESFNVSLKKSYEYAVEENDYDDSFSDWKEDNEDMIDERLDNLEDYSDDNGRGYVYNALNGQDYHKY